MLARIELRNRRGGVLNLPLEDFENGYGVAGIEGLDPVEAVLVSSGFAGKDGEQYYAARRAKRNLKLAIEMIPDFNDTSVRSLRKNLYNFLMPKSEVTIRFVEDLGSFVDIVGHVESFDAPLFTKDPVANAVVVCHDPDFFDPNPFTVSGQTVLATADPATSRTLLPYLGSVEAGILFTLKPNKAVSSFSIIQQLAGGDTYQMDFAESLVAGDTLVISTISGSMGASLTRAGTLSSVLWGISPQSPWLQLQPPGDNYIRVVSAAANVPWTIQYVNRHGGL